ncbi:MAG: LPXTG cell wall anchor domain-containing protein [Candidatus Saccharibacteria bacterium]|jgi:LPXTG-motif cell wall-anchored protein|nr:MAG: LPXTG cell wall anchor domain-containing protein [Candidatus Saccharibacteria bacterium]
MVRTNQGGSVLSFVIIGVILAAILVGGVYMVRQQTSQPSGEAPQEVVEEPPATTPTEETEKEAEKPQKEEPVQQTPQTEKEVELPQTGPAESLVSLIAIALLGFTATSYLRSRRAGLSL